MWYSTLFFLSSVIASSLANNCNVTLPKSYFSQRIYTPIEVDGNLNEPAWEAAKWSQPFGDIETGASVSSRIQSRYKMVQDSQFIYIAVEMKNPLADKQHNQAFSLSKLGIFYNPRSTNHNYKQIMINPYGQTEELLWNKPPTNGGSNSTSWSLGSQSKSAIMIQGSGQHKIASRSNDLDKSWTVEWALPINQLDVTMKRGEENNFEGDDLDPNRSSMNIFVIMPSTAFGLRLKKRQNVQYITQTWTPQGSRDIQNPEYWGSFGFSGKNVTTPPKDTSALPRYILNQVYHAQADYFKTHQRYTNNLSELSVDGPPLGACTPKPVVQVSGDGQTYVAELLVGNFLGQINQDRYTQFLRCQN